MLQSMTDLNPEVTVTSIHEVGAYDLISWSAMLEGLLRMAEIRSSPLCACFTATHPRICGKTN